MRPADIPAVLDSCGRAAVMDLVRFFSGARFFLGGTFVLAVLLMLPDSVLQSLPVICPFRLVTGRPCPGCGVVHCLSSLVHGHPAAAFRAHPFAMMLAVAAAPAYPLRKILEQVRPSTGESQVCRLFPPAATGWLFAGFCACWAAWWAVRLGIG